MEILFHASCLIVLNSLQYNQSGSVIGINEKARENTKVHPEKG
jgi:hypothetical protein